ncbi:hypothetical protein ZYGR_0S01530 [Zygosaccharomyces rouxii]|uniref:ZYRO0F05896p n=2 Tax=Zygosaccharomyces rouxii TaxID=4956 RepID=C5DXK9_ZYGRC|nr:uncharacterized protein ZYRO0F05896g [Zygosaccharomyces rouxii]GAV50019.1 hypothetical protein ZYGR_0S01530 [Zygosaccharomyces rouxii]CAR28520.1 ZYRO0F05896p [Zygosaccharomyces rouxii]
MSPSRSLSALEDPTIRRVGPSLGIMVGMYYLLPLGCYFEKFSFVKRDCHAFWVMRVIPILKLTSEKIWLGG